MSIDSFVGVFQGGARPNLFKVVITSPYLGIAAADLSFLCKGAALPGRTIGTIEVPYLNRKIPFAGDPTNTDFQITVLNDTDFLIRRGFESWQAAIQDRQVVTGTALPTDYFSTAVVIQLDRNKLPIRTYTLYNVWPSDLSQIELNYSNNDQVEEFTVGLKYSHFDVV